MSKKSEMMKENPASKREEIKKKNCPPKGGKKTREKLTQATVNQSHGAKSQKGDFHKLRRTSRPL